MKYYTKIRIMAACVLTGAILFLSSCSFAGITPPFGNNISDNVHSEYNYESMPSDNSQQSNNNAPQNNPSAQAPSVSVPDNNADTQTPSGSHGNEEPSSAASSAPSYSSYSKQQVMKLYEDALRLTRSYQGNFTVQHTEAFNAEVKEATPNNSLVKTLANYIVDLVGSEGSQTLNFSNGRATNKDNEVIPILLPQRTDYSLPAEGVASAIAAQEGDLIHIQIVLVPETVTMGEVPKYNSTAIGYLDTSDMDFKVIKISRVDIKYSGSIIDAYIRPDGYLQTVTYVINMSTYAELSGMGISGSGTLEGAQTEKWDFKW